MCQNSLPLSDGQNKKIIFMPHQNDTYTATWNKEIKEFVELSTIIHLREREREREREEKEQDLIKRIGELNGPSYFEYWMLKSQKTEVKGFLKEFEWWTWG